MLKWVLSFIFSFFVLVSQAQKDTSFWFAVPEITFNNGSSHSDRPVYFRITTFNKPTNVTISNPAAGAFNLVMLNIPAFSNKVVDVTQYLDQMENKPANIVLNYGVHITSDNPITVYYDEASINNPEIFSLKGQNALGLDFVIPGQTIMFNDSTKAPAATSSFDIVATENNTTITITPILDIIGHAAGIPFTIVLNRGQTFSCTAVGYLPSKHLAGSSVVANKPIAITIKDDSIGGAGYFACYDLAGDQIVPIDKLGTKYISLPGYLNKAATTPPTDWLFIFATKPNTTVKANGNIIAVMNRGNSVTIPSNNDVFYIESDEPIYVLQLSGSGCEVGHALLPQIECSGSYSTGFTRSKSTEMYLHLLVKNGGEAGFSFNNQNNIIIASQFNPVPFARSWSFARIPISLSTLQQDSSVIISNNLQQFHLGVIELNNGNGARYGYFSNFNTNDQNIYTNKPNNIFCEGDTIQFFSAVTDTNKITWQWTGPNGFSSILQNPFNNKAQINNAGKYICIANNPFCSALKDSLQLIIKPSPKPKIIAPSVVCENDFVRVVAKDSIKANTFFSWTGPNGFTNSSYVFNINNFTKTDSGKYYLRQTESGCSSIDSLLIIVKPIPLKGIKASSLICYQDSFFIKAIDSTVGLNYLWTGPNNFQNINQTIVFNNAKIQNSGLYKLMLSVGSCITKDSIEINVLPKPSIVFDSIQPLCKNNSEDIILKAKDTSKLAGTGIFSGAGVDALGKINVASINDFTKIKYTYKANNGCVDVKERVVKVYPIPTIILPKEYKIEAGKTVRLNLNIMGSYDSLQWLTNYNIDNVYNKNPIVNPIKPANYIVQLKTNSGCVVQDSTFVHVNATIEIPNAFSPNGDGTNDFWVIKDKYGLVYVEALVFNRNGHVIYNERGYNLKWNGKYKNENVPIGTYYYLVKAKTIYGEVEYSGWVLLIK